jgi:hypothetical protein
MDLAGYRPTLDEVAGLFGKSTRWIAGLRAKGNLPGDGGTLKDFVSGWIDLAQGKSVDEHKTRLAKAKADQAEIKTAQMRGELLPAPDVNRAVQGAFARVRSKLLSLPSKMAPRISTMKSAVEIEETLTELVHEALAELASTQVGCEETGAGGGGADAPDRIAGDGSGGGDVVAGADAASSPDGEPVGGRGRDAGRARPKSGGKRRTGEVGHQPG